MPAGTKPYTSKDFAKDNPNHYTRKDWNWMIYDIDSISHRRTLKSPEYITVEIGGDTYRLRTQQLIDFDTDSVWDTVVGTDYSDLTVRAGKDVYFYMCQPGYGKIPEIIMSGASTWPSGYDADSSRKIGGLHCMPGACVNLPVGHPYKDFDQGALHFNSIWDLNDGPRCSPEGMAKISLTPSDGRPALWVDIYLFNGVGTTLTSVFGATIKDTIDWMTFVDYAGAAKKTLLTDAEFQLAAAGSNEETHISTGLDPVTVTFPVDTAGRSMISNYGVIGMCGIMYQWILDGLGKVEPDGTVTAASKTATAYHAASPGGNPIYVKYAENGEPYLCCNMAIDTADKWLTFGTDYRVLIKHDADAATGSTQLYLDEDATQPSRPLSALARGKDAYVATNNPFYVLKITYNAAPATPGVAITFDDGSDERLEFTSPTSVNGTIDLAQLYPNYNAYDYSTKGSYTRYGGSYDVKQIAGGHFQAGVGAGSRCRFALYPRWITQSFIGARGCSN